jgi:TRAP-type uncharacterized transport system substrate-binding protein
VKFALSLLALDIIITINVIGRYNNDYNLINHSNVIIATDTIRIPRINEDSLAQVLSKDENFINLWKYANNIKTKIATGTYKSPFKIPENEAKVLIDSLTKSKENLTEDDVYAFSKRVYNNPEEQKDLLYNTLQIKRKYKDVLSKYDRETVNRINKKAYEILNKN